MNKDMNDMLNQVTAKVGKLSKQVLDMAQKGTDDVKASVQSMKELSDVRKMLKNQVFPKLRDQLAEQGNYRSAALMDDLVEMSNNDLKQVDDAWQQTFAQLHSLDKVQLGLNSLMQALLIVLNEGRLNNFNPNGYDVLSVFDILVTQAQMVQVRAVDVVKTDQADESKNQSSVKDESKEELKDVDEDQTKAKTVEDRDFESLTSALEDEFKDTMKKAMADPTFKAFVSSLNKDDQQKKVN